MRNECHQWVRDNLVTIVTILISPNLQWKFWDQWPNDTSKRSFSDKTFPNLGPQTKGLCCLSTLELWVATPQQEIYKCIVAVLNESRSAGQEYTRLYLCYPEGGAPVSQPYRRPARVSVTSDLRRHADNVGSPLALIHTSEPGWHYSRTASCGHLKRFFQ